ncbi:MAG: hypothetical protein H7066_05630, partial [Cytophagaceae bacterium]|nr:hypothetical protein [Gemmatimonadaceae bacterium]
ARLSSRAQVARTIADLEGAESIGRSHVGEALFFKAVARVPLAEVPA